MRPENQNVRTVLGKKDIFNPHTGLAFGRVRNGKEKAMSQKITSRYWRVIVLNTKEEQVFDNREDALKWCHKVVLTFCEDMEFFITEITERSQNIILKKGEPHVIDQR